MKILSNLVKETYDKLLSEVFQITEDNLYDVTVEVKTTDGITVRKSWKDRETFLKEMEEA